MYCMHTWIFGFGGAVMWRCRQKSHRSTDAQVFERGMHDPIRDEAFSGGNESCNVKRNHFLLGKRKEQRRTDGKLPNQLF